MTFCPRSLAATIITAVALADVPASAAVPLPICIVIRDHANVPDRVLGQAIQIVADAYRLLGIGIVWIKSPVCADITTMHLSILPRRAQGEGGDRIIGVDGPDGLEPHVHLAHILYRRIGDDRVTGHALGYVMAHLVAGTLRSTDVNARPTIVYGDRALAQRLIEGTTLFTSDEVQAILASAASRAR